MNTIPLPEIITRLATKVNCGDEIAGAFLREFSVVVTQGLAADGVVRIDGLGTFKVTADVDGNPTVDFAPEASLAETVNGPFAMFESVEMADSLTEEELTQEGDTSANSPEEIKEEVAMESQDSSEYLETPDPPEPQEPAANSVVPPPVPPRFISNEPKPEAEVIAPVIEEEKPRHEPVRPSAYDAPVPVRLEPESRVTIKRVGHSTLTLVVTAIAGCLLGLVIGYMAYRYMNFGLPGNVEVVEDGILFRQDSGKAEEIVVEEEILSDTSDEDSLEVVTVEEPAAVAATEVVTDTVKPGNYLSVMARRHYGNAKFWVYIYIENKDKIRDPDNLEDGMVLVIPPTGKYDIDPSSKESLRKADQEAYKAMAE